jgi:hypothetical protein
LRSDTKRHVAWPSRQRPASVRVDGVAHTEYNADGIVLTKPFQELVAQW